MILISTIQGYGKDIKICKKYVVLFLIKINEKYLVQETIAFLIRMIIDT